MASQAISPFLGGECVHTVLQCVAVCCSVLQCVAVCCSVLQCVAACCSMLQCVAVCCSVLQCVCIHPSERTHQTPTSHRRCRLLLRMSMCCGPAVWVCCSVLRCDAKCSPGCSCGQEVSTNI